LTTVTPQLLIPLVGDLAEPRRRATALSIVVSGLFLGLLIARLISGILTQYTSWRNVYWFSLGVQYLILVLLFFCMPDYPSMNPEGINYFFMLYSMVKMLFKHPILVQSCLVGFLVSSSFPSFWTTLTFLLSSPPYSYNSVIISLFSLIGISAMIIGPFHSRIIIDRFVPYYSVILGLCYCLIGIVLGTYIGKFTVAGPIIQAWFIDIGMQTSQIANRMAIFGIEPAGRNRVNTAFMVSVFCGQLMGTAVGNILYAEGGWIASGSSSVGFVGAAFVVCLARGPWETRWLGWRGGWRMRRDLENPSTTSEPAIEQVMGDINAAERAVIEGGENVVVDEKI
jgi:predicted MFS family arabinose efflux permease